MERRERRPTTLDAGGEESSLVKTLKHASLLAAIGFASALSSTVCAGPDWVEDDVDAGNQIDTAQPIVNIGTGTQLQRIIGRLTGAAGDVFGNGADDFDDLYQIFISDPGFFEVSTVDTKTNFQTSLWLFDSKGFGLLGNVIAPTPVAGELQGSQLLPFSTDGTEIFISKPGIYYLCISSADREAVGAIIGGEVAGLSGPIFSFQEQGEISGPDGPAGGSPLNGWIGQGVAGDYEVRVQGVSFIPAPGALSLLAVGLLGVNGRRRRN
jgi:hypothetical protein